MPEFDFEPISQVVAGIEAQRKEITDGDPRLEPKQLVLGLCGDGTFVSIDEIHGVDDPYEARFIVRMGQAVDWSTGRVLDDVDALPEIDLTEDKLRYSMEDGVIRQRNGHTTISVNGRNISIPSALQQNSGARIEMDKIEVIPLVPLEERDVRKEAVGRVMAGAAIAGSSTDQVDPVSAAERDRKEYFGKNVRIAQQVLSKYKSTVYDRETLKPNETGMRRRIGFDAAGERPLIPAEADHYNSEVAEYRDELAEGFYDEPYLEVRGFAANPKCRFNQWYCAWKLEPNKNRATVRVLQDIRDGQPVWAEPIEMTNEDHAQLLTSMLADTKLRDTRSVYGQALNGENARAIRQEPTPPFPAPAWGQPPRW
jgi:hypothetical protein